MLVSLQNLYFSYQHNIILENINLDIFTGDFLGIVGPNGGGKTTLLKIILGLLKPTAGQILIQQQPLKKSQLNIAYVPQFFNFAKTFPISVSEVVLLARLPYTWLRLGYYSKQDKIIAQQAMEETSIASLAKQALKHLSGGQLQRVFIARALACQPKLLILDEPTANIDFRAEEDIFDLLKQLNQRMTIIVVSHDIGFISQYINKIACLNRTLVYHSTQPINDSVIQKLYGNAVGMIQHQQEPPHESDH